MGSTAGCRRYGRVRPSPKTTADRLRRGAGRGPGGRAVRETVRPDAGSGLDSAAAGIVARYSEPPLADKGLTCPVSLHGLCVPPPPCRPMPRPLTLALAAA